jgi:hypothetical protein
MVEENVELWTKLDSMQFQQQEQLLLQSKKEGYV